MIDINKLERYNNIVSSYLSASTDFLSCISNDIAASNIVVRNTLVITSFSELLASTLEAELDVNKEDSTEFSPQGELIEHDFSSNLNVENLDDFFKDELGEDGKG